MITTVFLLSTHTINIFSTARLVQHRRLTIAAIVPGGLNGKSQSQYVESVNHLWKSIFQGLRMRLSSWNFIHTGPNTQTDLADLEYPTFWTKP